MDEKEKKRSDYGSYIAYVCEKIGCSKSDFGKKVLRFEVCNNTPVGIINYTRNSVGNWINGSSFLEYKESLVCIALLDYCGSTEAVPGISKEEEEDRLNFVNEKLWKYLGKKLYSRSLTDAMLILAARGIISVKDIPCLVKEANLSKVKMLAKQAKTLCLENITDNMIQELCDTQSKTEAERMIGNHKDYYALGYKTLGFRIQNMWEKMNPDFSFKKAISIYAPKYQNTYRKQLFNDNLKASREYIVHFCTQMRLTREDINQALRTAQMKELEEKEPLPDYFDTVKKMSLSKRLGYLVYFLAYIESIRSWDEAFERMFFLPVYSYFNHYLDLKSTKRCYEELEITLRENPTGFIGRLKEGSLACVADLENFVYNTNCEIDLWEESEKSYYEAYRESFQIMYEPARNKIENLPMNLKEMSKCMYLLATFSYAMILEKEYKGELLEKDLIELEKRLQQDQILSEEDKESIYFFLNTMWVLFLDAGELMSDKKGNLYGMRGEPLVKTMSFDWEDAIESMVECWNLSLDKKENDVSK